MILYPLFVFSLVASATIANKIIVSYLPPFLFVGLRMGISGVILLLTCANGLKRSDFFKKNIFALHVIALFTTFLPSLLRAYAQMKLASSRVAFWGTFEPFITALYMRILFKNELTVWQIFGCIIGFLAGAFFFIMNDVASLNLSTLCYITLPDFAQLLSVIVSRYGWIRAQQMMKGENLNPTQLNGMTYTISGFFALVTSFVTHEYSRAVFPCQWNFVLASFYTLFVGNMIAYTLYSRLIKNQSMTFVSIASLSVPLFIHILAPFVFPQEKVAWTFFVSLGLIFVALWVFNYKPKKSRAE